MDYSGTKTGWETEASMSLIRDYQYHTWSDALNSFDVILRIVYVIVRILYIVDSVLKVIRNPGGN